MPNALKCPNPSCPFLFDPSQVPVGAVLTCPRCGMRFTLGSAAGANPPADLNLSQTTFSDEPVVRVRKPVAPRSSNSIWLPVAVVIGIAGLLVFAILQLRSKPSKAFAGRYIEFREINCAFALPEKDWERDDNVKAEAKSNLLGFLRSAPDGKVAFAASSFETRNPQPGELHDGIRTRLRHLFEELDAAPEPDGGIWAGQKAVKYRFRGMAQGTTHEYAGEAWSIAYKGIGYWFIGWSDIKDIDQLLPEMDELRNRFSLLDYREDWKATTTAALILVGREADYRLTDGDRWWKAEEGADAKTLEDDPAADLLITARFKSREQKDLPSKATLVTMILEPTDDPLAVVRNHVRKKYERIYGVTLWSEVTDPPQGDPSPTTEAGTAEIIRLKSGQGSTARLVVLSAIRMADSGKIVAVEAYCPWSDRFKWEQRLMQLAASLRPGKM